MRYKLIATPEIEYIGQYQIIDTQGVDANRIYENGEEAEVKLEALNEVESYPAWRKRCFNDAETTRGIAE